MAASIGIQVFQSGFTAATSATSASTALPTAANNVKINYVRVSASGECYVRLGAAAVVATANDLLIQPADSMILAVNGATHIAYIQGGALQAARVNVVPVENL
ncbi:MAG: hypothetical protein NTW47_03345 [Proteobacteria bacterium]|nr:hypothetical protein [Pseudomonadota bacterium]